MNCGEKCKIHKNFVKNYRAQFVHDKVNMGGNFKSPLMNFFTKRKFKYYYGGLIQSVATYLGITRLQKDPTTLVSYNIVSLIKEEMERKITIAWCHSLNTDN